MVATLRKHLCIITGHIMQVMKWVDYDGVGEFTHRYNVWIQLQNYLLEFMKQDYVENILEDCGWFEADNLQVMELYHPPKMKATY